MRVLALCSCVLGVALLPPACGGVLGSSVGEERVLHPPLSRQLPRHLSHQGHRQTLADFLQGL